ncbi:roadblock/LC7 domain-containing protein [Rhodotorula paludigena]|uniref:roadblock/LC7 domain-containing protein n=1 Tax=Rhodotorula paludigena TaxID=86838 RepID=UPI003182884D
MTSTTAPPEVEATLNRLASYKNVQGVLILARPNGIILRSTGSLFALPPATAAAAAHAGDDEGVEGTSNGAEPVAAPTTSETARAYAKAAVRMVEAVGSEVRDVDEDKADDLRFLRIRTKRHELIITPDEQYILVVVQDPTH